MKLTVTEQKKEFALSKIAPYFKNPELCGYDGERCTYYTNEGNVCVAGACMIFPERYRETSIGIASIIEDEGEEILKKDCRNKLDPEEWQYLQQMHDCIARRNIATIKEQTKGLGLFEYEELQAYANKL